MGCAGYEPFRDIYSLVRHAALLHYLTTSTVLKIQWSVDNTISGVCYTNIFLRLCIDYFVSSDIWRNGFSQPVALPVRGRETPYCGAFCLEGWVSTKYSGTFPLTTNSPAMKLSSCSAWRRKLTHGLCSQVPAGSSTCWANLFVFPKSKV